MALSGIARVVFNLLVLRLMSAAALGEVAGIVAAGTLVSLIVAPAMAAAVGRYPAQAGSNGGAVARRLIIAALVGLVFTAPLVVPVLWLTSASHSPLEFAAAGGYCAGFGASTVVRSLYFWSGRHRRYIRAEAASWMLFAMMLVGVLVSHIQELLPFCFIAQTLVFAGLSLVDHRDMLIAHVDADLSWREILAFGGLNVVGSFPSMATPQLALLILTAVSQQSVVGTYAALVSLSSPLQLLPRALALAFYPRISRSRAVHATAYRAEATTLARLLVPVSMAPVVILTGTAPLWLGHLVGSSDQDVVTAFALLLVGQAVAIIAVPAVAAQTAGPLREVAQTTAWSGLGLAVSLVVWMVIPLRPALTVIALGVGLGTVIRAGGPLVSVVGRASPRRGAILPMLWCLLATATIVGQVAGHLVVPVVAIGFALPVLAFQAGTAARGGRRLAPVIER